MNCNFFGEVMLYLTLLHALGQTVIYIYHRFQKIKVLKDKGLSYNLRI